MSVSEQQRGGKGWDRAEQGRCRGTRLDARPCASLCALRREQSMRDGAALTAPLSPSAGSAAVPGSSVAPLAKKA